MQIPTRCLRFGVCLAVLILAQSGCATLTQKRSQEITVTSDPSGARILVDGDEVAVTPATIKLRRSRISTIGLMKADYAPYVVTTRREYSMAGAFGSLFAGAIFAWLNYEGLYLIGQDDETPSTFRRIFLGHDAEKGRTAMTFVKPLLFTAGLSTAFDLLTGASFRHRPAQITATLVRPSGSSP